MEKNFDLTYHYAAKMYEYFCTAYIDKYDEDIVERIANWMTSKFEPDAIRQLQGFQNDPKLDCFSVKNDGLEGAKELVDQWNYEPDLIKHDSKCVMLLESLNYGRVFNLFQMFAKENKKLARELQIGYFDKSVRYDWCDTLYDYLQDTFSHATSEEVKRLNPKDVEKFVDNSYQDSFEKINGNGSIRLIEEYQPRKRINKNGKRLLPKRYEEVIADHILGKIKQSFKYGNTPVSFPLSIYGYLDQDGTFCVQGTTFNLLVLDIPEKFKPTAKKMLDVGSLIDRYIFKLHVSEIKSEDELPANLHNQIMKDIEKSVKPY